MDFKLLNIGKFFLKLKVFAVNVTFVNDGQQINGSTDEHRSIKLFDKSMEFRLTNGMCCTWYTCSTKHLFCNLTQEN